MSLLFSFLLRVAPLCSPLRAWVDEPRREARDAGQEHCGANPKSEENDPLLAYLRTGCWLLLQNLLRVWCMFALDALAGNTREI